MRLGQWIIVLILTGICALSSAEIYKYVDEQGKVHYTDDLGSVPVEQRPKADEYEVPYDQSASEVGTEREKPQTEESKEDIEETEGVSRQTEAPAKEDKEVRLQTEAPAKEGEEKTTEQKLREVGARLTEEYRALVKEREKLDKISTMKLTPADHRELVKRIRDYNSRTEDYERRRAAFNKEVEAYNASIKKEVKELR
jgi:hypothetical protein